MALRDHILMVTLCAVILINIIAIVLLNNRLADQEQPGTRIQPPPTDTGATEPPRQVIRTQPAVRTLVLEDPGRCPDCFNVSLYLEALNDTVNMQPERVAPERVALFNSTRLPALAFNATLAEYPAIIQDWENVGSLITIPSGEYAGRWYVLPSLNAPYYAINDSRVHGRVTVTYLTMESCPECYDVYVNRDFLRTSRIIPYREVTVDAQSAQGRALIAKYNITAVPTIIMDREAGEYENLHPGWDLVGTVEPDGSYVLRELRRLEVAYYDLNSKKLMKP